MKEDANFKVTSDIRTFCYRKIKEVAGGYSVMATDNNTPEFIGVSVRDYFGDLAIIVGILYCYSFFMGIIDQCAFCNCQP